MRYLGWHSSTSLKVPSPWSTRRVLQVSPAATFLWSRTSSVHRTLRAPAGTSSFHALLETAFTCPAKYVKNGVCAWVTAGDIGALLKPSQEMDEVLASAEACLREARLRLPACGLTQKPFEDNALLKVLTLLDVGVGRLVLDKQKESKEPFEAVRDAGLHFLTKLQAAFPKANLAPFEGLWKATPVKKGATVVSTADATLVPISEISATGDVTSVLARLRAQGFDLKANVSQDGEVVWRVIGVAEEAGEILLEAKQAKEDGSFDQLRVPVSTFFESWALAEEAAKIQRHSGWPAKSALFTNAAVSIQHRAWALAALTHLAGRYTKGLGLAEALELFVSPAKRVVTKDAFAAGALVLTPDTTTVAAKKPAEEVAGGALRISFSPAEEMHSYWLCPAQGADSVAPLWLVSTSADEAKCNLVWTSFTVTVGHSADHSGAAELTAEPKVRPPGRLKAKGAASDMTKVQVSIPALINSAPLEAGAELTIYRPPAAKRAKPSGPIALGSVLKKATS